LRTTEAAAATAAATKDRNPRGFKDALAHPTPNLSSRACEGPRQAVRIFVSAGEASGDAYGAALVSVIQRLVGEGDSLSTKSRANLYEGLGGRRMAAAEVSLIADTGNWGAISFVQSLKTAPRILRGYYAAKRRLRQDEAGLFIPIDFGYVNIRLARHAKNHGWRVLYFVPPGSWNRERQGRDLPALTDAISTPFSWSADLLRAAGANAYWFGHPIRQILGDPSTVTRGDGLAILPGSRKHEITENLPLIAEALRDLNVPSVEFGLAPSVDVARFRLRWSRLAPDRKQDVFTQGDSASVFRRARAAIVCSGTATLEAALCGCPMVVVYRVSKLVQFEAALIGFKRPKFIALPNILLDRMAVPELLQTEATTQAVVGELSRILPDGEPREAQIISFKELESLLGPSDAITQTANFAISLTGLTTKRPPRTSAKQS
jgi:lipid-A-disaccharide synthase